jgi:hypothetical protein
LVGKNRPNENPDEQPLPPNWPLSRHECMCIPLLDAIYEDHDWTNTSEDLSAGRQGLRSRSVPDGGTFFVIHVLYG